MPQIPVLQTLRLIPAKIATASIIIITILATLQTSTILVNYYQLAAISLIDSITINQAVIIMSYFQIQVALVAAHLMEAIQDDQESILTIGNRMIRWGPHEPIQMFCTSRQRYRKCMVDSPCLPPFNRLVKVILSWTPNLVLFPPIKIIGNFRLTNITLTSSTTSKHKFTTQVILYPRQLVTSNFIHQHLVRP